MPKLSIITINYNNLNGLKKTVQSVLSQTSKGFEYIVVDGGSNDGSTEYIKEFAENEKTIKIVWVSEKDGGIYNALNKGIRMAGGEFLQFLNSGDALVDNTVTESMIASLPENCNIQYGNMLKSLPKGLYRDKGFAGVKPTFLDFYYGTLNHSPAYIRRTLFDKYGFYDESLRIVSDWKWYLQVIILSNVNINYVPIDVTHFDMNGISSVNKLLDMEERKKVLHELIPAYILTDYENNAYGMQFYERIKKFNTGYRFFKLYDRYYAWLERKLHNNYIR